VCWFSLRAGESFLASGGSSHKLQAMLGQQTVLQTTLAAVQASGLPWHLECGPHPGMGDSIAAAVKATAGAKGWLILPADLPLVQAATLHELALQLTRLDSRELHVIQPSTRDGRVIPWLLAGQQLRHSPC
jgi:molybdenum cofactor cytidylyltransferase